jgi:predicted DNA-binding transcriptional regulator AlpA
LNHPAGQGRPTTPQGAGEPEPAVHPPETTDRLIGIREIRELFSLGRTAAYELTRRPDFPAPVPLSQRCYRWWAKEVTAFAASLRDGGRSGHNSASRPTARRISPAADAPAPRITGKVRIARSRRTKP